ncbi:LysM peptidoglycan-binding domain-containing protein [Glaesserella sp.]|uniref:LysM peptidoglycan-binding domain-containing protein n=1 Tax=Glaesserella sp. TaxID=2094731 RepID=UPI0035A0E5B7
MKKSFLLLPLVAIVLAGCSNSSNDTAAAEVTDANSSWQTEVQQTEMPSSMAQPVYNNTQPTYNNTQPTYSAPQPTAGTTYPATQQPNYNQSGYGQQTETVGGCQVVRDANNAPVYGQIQKGCYTGDSYTVGKGDTMFLVAYLTGSSVNNIAALNNMSEPYQLRVGQVLRVR